MDHVCLSTDDGIVIFNTINTTDALSMMGDTMKQFALRFAVFLKDQRDVEW